MPRRTQAKAPKDMHAPKRPNSGYLLFSKKRMSALRGEHAGKRASDLAKIIGAEWKGMTTEDKMPYQTESIELKEKYNVAMAEYKKTEKYAEHQAKLKKFKEAQKDAQENRMDVDENDDRPAVPVKARKRPKDLNAPKKPMTSFFLLQQVRRPQLKQEHPTKQGKELVQMMGAEWRGMTAEQKEPLEAQAREKKAAYAVAMEAYKESDNYRKHQAVVAAWQAEQKQVAQILKRQKQAEVRETAPVSSPPAARRNDTESEEYSDSSSSAPPSPRKVTEESRPVRNFGCSSSSESSSGSSGEEDDEDEDVEMVEENRGIGQATEAGTVRRDVEEDDGDDEESVSGNGVDGEIMED